MDKKTEKYLLIGGVVLAAGYFLYRNYQANQANAAAPAAAADTANAASSATSATTAISNTATASTAPAPVGDGQVDVYLEYAYGDNQVNPYQVHVGISFVNNTAAQVTISQFSANLILLGMAAQYASGNASKWPMPYTGNIGTVTIPGTIVLQPGGQVTNQDFAVSVPVNSATNLYIANLMAIASQPGPRQTPVTLTGQMYVNGVAQNVKSVLNI